MGIVSSLMAVLGIVILLVSIFLLYLGINLHYNALNRNFSKAYYLIPILFSLIGTIIVYLIFKNTDKELGNKLGWIGVANVLIFIALEIPFLVFAALVV
ncbi:MAG: hypothetical protein QXP39_03235 [Candidatus Aenigmatarchaeota archaeon]